MTGPHRDDAKVRQIREAARELFLRHGFGAVSTAALAKHAGVSKETLYSRYPSKEAVLADVLEHLIVSGQLEAQAHPRLETRADLERALSRFARELVGRLLQRDYLELARIVIAETPRLPEVGTVFRRAVPERALQGAEALLAAGSEAGLVGAIDHAAAARMLVGPLVIQVLLHGLLVAPGESDDAATAVEVDTHVAMLLQALCPEVER